MSFEVEEIEKKGGIIAKAPSCHECRHASPYHVASGVLLQTPPPEGHHWPLGGATRVAQRAQMPSTCRRVLCTRHQFF